ncbi:MAG: regulatory protein RecX [Gammaproteobacteria bacterium]
MKPRPDREPEQDPAVIRKVAMDCLARREHGVQELGAKLQAKGYAAQPVAAALAKLVADNLLSDARFTEAFVHSRYQRGSGPQKIRAELHERGIDEGLIDDCIRVYDERWQALVSEVRERKYGAQVPADFRERSRQMRFLQQRGFTAEQISRAFSDW